jgi:SAM-dependent methyltransferase
MFSPSNTLPATAPITGWEALWAPYDEPTYARALAWIRPNDVVLEIGAGDLRLSRRLAARARQVYALEIEPHLVEAAVAGQPLPENLSVICADARHIPFPAGITTAVLLMGHCTHYRLYAEKTLAAGGRWLITNARWRMGVERIDLARPPLPFTAVAMGWYACRCGHTGFVPGPAEKLTGEVLAAVHEVGECPRCRPYKT